MERVISKAGLGSRTDARGWISAGKIRVNGKIVRNADQWVDMERDRVLFEGKPLRPTSKTYILLYKPKGFLTTWRDPQGRPTVYDLLKDAGVWLSPVGRLDLDTSGLLLMTNDNDFAERVTNPDHHVPRSYQIKAATVIDDEQLERLRQGVELIDGPTRSATVKRLRENARHTVLEMTISEGRNRQVRRMIEAVGSKVLKLVRTGIGPIRIGELPIGKWRTLTNEELCSLTGERKSKA